jgi:peptidoglycan/LPS O-acetylase OafA/YrhL
VSSANLDRSSRFLGLDGLRGLCAIGVVIFHHKHFAFTRPHVFDESGLPFKPLLDPLYTHGLLLVEVFFILSGFIFYRLYAARLKPKATSPLSSRAFWVARIARLYPLYLITLVSAAAILSLTSGIIGQRFVYEEDGLLVFAQSLLMIQQWQPSAVHSFNGPNWSLSVEILLYGLFFMSARLGLSSPLALLGLIIAALLIQLVLGRPWFDLMRGPPAFFLGGLIASLSLSTHFMKALIQNQGSLMLGLGLGLLICLIALYWPSLINRSMLAPIAKEPGFIYGLIPLIILLSLIEGGLIQRALIPFQKLGDLSYSLYLWHFPWQCVLYVAITQIWPENSHMILMSPLFLAFVIGLNLIWASLSLERLEKPMQKWILNEFNPIDP